MLYQKIILDYNIWYACIHVLLHSFPFLECLTLYLLLPYLCVSVVGCLRVHSHVLPSMAPDSDWEHWEGCIDMATIQSESVSYLWTFSLQATFHLSNMWYLLKQYIQETSSLLWVTWNCHGETIKVEIRDVFSHKLVYFYKQNSHIVSVGLSTPNL